MNKYYLGNTTGERVKWLREHFNLSRQELYEALKKSYPDLAPSYTTIQGWEQAGKQPRRNMITILANFFKCTEDFLLCKTDCYVSNRLYSLRIQITDLFNYDGEPVWLSLKTEDGRYVQSYALVNAECGRLVFSDQQSLAFDKINKNVEIYTKN